MSALNAKVSASFASTFSAVTGTAGATESVEAMFIKLNSLLYD
jgi:hypothetical protein